MANILEQIATYLATNGVGTLGDSIFIGYEPDLPQDVVVVFPSGGRPARTDGKEYPAVQVLVRNKSSKAGLQKAEQVRCLLHGKSDVLTTEAGICFANESSPIQLGRNSKGEFLFVVNFSWLVTIPS